MRLPAPSDSTTQRSVRSGGRRRRGSLIGSLNAIGSAGAGGRDYPRSLVDRDEIERQDFPAARRGYDADAVREHLRRVADEFEALAARPRAASVAEGASTQVRAILEAAETSARQLRDEAGREASDHVERVGRAAGELLAKLDRAQGELDALRSAARSLAASLDELRRDAGALGAVEPPARNAPAAGDEPAPALNGTKSDDEAGARLVALNMALDGAPRAETARYLAEHFELPDVEALLHDVYTSAGK
jgi:DivIVA domain-containing protein